MTATKEDMAAMGAEIKRRRLAAGFSQVGIARAVGGSNKNFNNVENGHNWPSLPLYISICHSLRLPRPPLWPAGAWSKQKATLIVE